MATRIDLMTADDLFALPGDGLRRELVRGEVIEMSPAGHPHGQVAMRVGWRLGEYVERNDLGATFAAETGFRLESDPDTVRAPDAAFVRKERLPEGEGTRAYWPGAPDLAIEVLSPEDRYSEVEEKALQWLDAGARMVIVLDPRKRSATVYRSRRQIVALTEADTLDGADVVPGWSVPLRELFA